MTKHTDKEVAAIQKDYDAVVGEYVAESIRESDKATKLSLREAFDLACEIATSPRLNVMQHDEAVAKIAELRARVGA